MLNQESQSQFHAKVGDKHHTKAPYILFFQKERIIKKLHPRCFTGNRNNCLKRSVKYLLSSTLNFQMFKLVLEKAEEPEIKLLTSAGSSKKQEFQKNIYFCFIDYAKAFDCVDHNKLKEMGIPDHLTCLLRNLYAGQEATVRTGPTRWTWVWVGSGSWCWIGSPGVLRFMGLQRVWHDWAVELNWTLHSLGLHLAGDSD